MRARFHAAKLSGVFFLILFIGVSSIHAAKKEDRDMVLEGLTGDITTNEYRSFIDKLQFLPPPPTNDIDNSMVDEKDGARIHGMQTFYEFTHDRRVLDMAIVWSDAFLHARNDPTNGRIVWTGKRELCWPNKAINNTNEALYSGTENGDVIEHIVNTARLILENPDIWNESAPTDTFGFGATYLERAKTYVRECQRSAETTIVPWYVRETKDGYHLIHPDSEVYYKYCESSGPVPWNQQQSIVGGLLRLAQCHRLLNDGNTNIAFYEKITADTANWFFACAAPVSAHNRVCYLWSYGLPRDSVVSPEVITESDYDMFIFRAYQANLGPTRLQMQRLINTARFLMYLGTNRFAGKVNGTSTPERHERKFLNFEWIEMSVLDHEFYNMTASAVLTSHEYWDNLAVEAAVLSAKHYWATHQPQPELADNLNAPKIDSLSAKHSRSKFPLISILGSCWGLSEILLNIFKRAKSTAVKKDRHTLKLLWLVILIAVAVGVYLAYHLHKFWMPYPETMRHIACVVVALGIILRWYAILYLGRFFTVNVAIAEDHRLIDTGPYRFIRHPSYTGSLLSALGVAMSLQNWISFLIVFVSILAVTVWRIHVEEQALAEGLGQPYRDYTKRTKRLVPGIY